MQSESIASASEGSSHKHIMFRKARARRAAGGVLIGVPFRGSRGGESERGRIRNILEQGPLPFWAHFREKRWSKISIEKQSLQKLALGGLLGDLWCQKSPQWVFSDNFLYIFWDLFGLWWNIENWAIAWEWAQSRGLERVRNSTNFDVFF